MRGRTIKVALAAAAACALLPAAARCAEVKPQGSVEVTIQVEGGKELTSAKVYAGSQSAAVAKAGELRAIAGVAPGRVAVTVDAVVGAVAGKGGKRYLGVAEAAVAAGRTEKVAVTVREVADIDAFCLECHPSPKGPKTKPVAGQIVRDLHISNVALEEKHLKQVRAYNATVARLEKEGKPHNFPILTEERVVNVAGKDVKRVFSTCESCHTLHLKTPNTKYARGPFRTKSDLCVGCHD